MPNPQYVTLTPNAVTTVTVTDSVVGQGAKLVKVTADDNGTAPIYFTTDGSTPTVAGAGCEVVLGNGRNYEVASAIVTGHDPVRGIDVNPSSVVKLISAAPAWVKVEVFTG